MTSTVTPMPVWASRPFQDRDRDEVLALFAEPDFYYRTEVPDSRPEWEILALLGDDTRLLFADGRLAGLYAVENEGAAHGSHFRVHLRLRTAAPLSWWCSAYQELVAALRWQREVVRVAVRFFEFDSRGLQVADALGLATEGTLADIVLHDGRRHGEVFFAQIWTPAS
jgi:hypothetical protein